MVTEAVKPMAGDVAGNDNGAVTDSRSLVDSLVASGALDPLFERIDGGRIELTGDGGLPGELTRVALERGLQAETTSHLGYAPGDGGVEGERRACELAQRFVSQDAVHAGGSLCGGGKSRAVSALLCCRLAAQALKTAGSAAVPYIRRIFLYNIRKESGRKGLRFSSICAMMRMLEE